MKKVLLLFLIAMLAVAVAVSRGQPRSVLHGTEPYTPTRLEWLAIELTARYRFDGTGGVGLSFHALPATDELQVFVAYTKGADRIKIQEVAQFGRQMAEQHAALHKWNWVRIREQLKESR